MTIPSFGIGPAIDVTGYVSDTAPDVGGTRLANPSRAHPSRQGWVEDERRMRASYLATNRALAPFIVPHRFEGDAAPETLRRAKLGYGISLNRSYLQEILGHIRGTSTAYQWGALDSSPEGDTEQDGAPGGGLARTLFTDATRTGVPLRTFMEGEVLEWLASSCGGFVVIDAPAEQVETLADEKALGKRPYFRFVPFSAVIDCGVDMMGRFRFVKFKELVDDRTPDGGGRADTAHFLLYELDKDTGDAKASRFDAEGKPITDDNGVSSTSFGKLTNTHGEAMLPLVPVILGKHPEIPFVGTGLLYGLDDIVIDLFNTMSEVRESYRSSTFGLLIHKGANAEDVRTQLSGGSLFVTLGEGPDNMLERLSAESAEVAAGLTLIELGVKAWALSAKRQAAEAMGTNAGATGPASGVALAAEFQLDLRPLLVTLCQTLDAIETECLFLAAQLAGEAVASADELSVTRATEFRLEDEASRIARLVTEYVGASLDLTPEMKVQLSKAWMKAANVIDTAEKVDPKDIPTPVEGAPPVEAAATVGEQIEHELRDLASAQHAGAVAKATAPTLMPDGTQIPPTEDGNLAQAA